MVLKLLEKMGMSGKTPLLMGNRTLDYTYVSSIDSFKNIGLILFYVPKANLEAACNRVS